MGLSAEIRQQLINSFKAEQKEHVQAINRGLLQLEKNPAAPNHAELLNEIFREAHSLKGTARAVGITTIESLGHALEDLLLNAKEGRLVFSAELFDLMYQALDAVDLVMTQLEAGHTTPPVAVLTLLARLEEVTQQLGNTATPPENHPVEVEAETKTETEPATAPSPEEEPAMLAVAPVGPSDETIRVSVSKLDALMGQFAELLGAKIRAEQRLAEVRRLQGLAAEWHKEWLPLRGSYNRLVRGRRQARRNEAYALKSSEMTALVEFITKNQDLLHAFNLQSNALSRQFANDTLRLSLIIDELQEEIKRVRMLPLATITHTFGRMVRDLAREQGKEINFIITGDGTELDKRVLEQIKDPLLHLLRNAIDHGLEPPERRLAAGKPPQGQIVLEAVQQGNNVVITISDDGRGLDRPAIRAAAVRRGLLSAAEAQKLSDDETVTLIFNSGLSTSQIITDISGRGVGLDVVRQNVEELHGALNVASRPNLGATFTLTLPLTLASSHGLLLRAGEQTFALPISTVVRMLRVPPGQITRLGGREAIIYDGKPIALARLADILELPAAPVASDLLTVVVVGVAEKRLGLIVDDLLGEQEIVMKNLGRQLVKVGGIAGATVLGSGQVILVLHTADLLKLAARASSRPPVAGAAQPAAQLRKTVLVVDDSITTRTLEKNILESAGYEVKLATDGEEALAALVSGQTPNLIVSDINMPRLDGFALTQRVRQDTRYAEIPIILVTSLDSPADKARGIEVGADAYIVKSSFDQGNLLETIEQLV